MSTKRVLAVFGSAMAIAVLFAACGGGGGYTMPQPSPSSHPSTSPTPSTSPSPTPTATLAYPPKDGTSFALSGTSTQTVTRFAPTPTPPPQVTTDAIAESAVVHTNQMFHGTSATDFKTTETDTGPNQTITTNSDIYFVFPPSTGNVLNIGFSSTDSNGVTLDVQYLSGNGIVAQLPLSSGWSNTAASAIVENDPDGTTTTQNISADGSYTATKNEVAGTTTVTENSDGTATELVPIDFFGTGGVATQFAVGAPSGGFIPFTVSEPSPAPTPPPVVISVPAWYTPSPTLASDTTNVVGVTTIPPGCAATSFGTTGAQLHEVKSRLDTMLGYTDNETIDTWLTNNAGPVCEKIADTINLYYDFTGQFGAPTLSGSPIQTTALTETLGLQSATPAGISRRPTSVRELRAPMAVQMAFARERVERFHQAFRQRQLRSMRNFLKRGILK